MLRFLCLIIVASICLGCGSSEYASAPSAYYREDDVQYYAGESVSMQMPETPDLPTNEFTKVSAEDAPEKSPLAGENRKIIYTASLAIVVDDFGPVEKSVAELVKQYGGFIASANVSLNQGSERSGTWVVRIPVATFEEFLDASGDMGVPERRQQNGQDVTEEYVDLEARIRSKKKLEERILELLAANDGAIKDVIAVERELSRVRTEIEQMEGRLRYLADRTELTTVTLSIREEQDYTPPQAPGLGTQIAQTFGNSTGSITTLGKNLLLAIVACTPWLVLGAVLIAPLWYWRRRATAA